MTVMQGVRVTVAAVGRGYPKTAVTTVTAVTPKDGHPPKERRNPPMPYAILRFQKRKAGGVAACERHNERKKEAYKSNPDIDMERSKNNYHLIVLSRKLNDALSSRLFYAHFDSHRDISHFKSSCFCELFF